MGGDIDCLPSRHVQCMIVSYSPLSYLRLKCEKSWRGGNNPLSNYALSVKEKGGEVSNLLQIVLWPREKGGEDKCLPHKDDLTEDLKTLQTTPWLRKREGERTNASPSKTITQASLKDIRQVRGVEKREGEKTHASPTKTFTQTYKLDQFLNSLFILEYF
eukprot:TRINITY_DN986_c0_g1_i2.p2 TRINITY_DN986_c0_g1~~TRINITY_DN986_c0_g1_i2.p2  ORF type:complete len:160 (-),score=19.52 TRINITY_DN986_c0_g1_i2:361-840(-)